MNPPVVDALRWLDAAPCAYLVTTVDGRIKWANRTVAEWIGEPDTEFAGRSIHDLLTPGGSIHFEAIAPSLSLSSRLGDVALDLRRRDGSPIHLLCNATVETPSESAAADDLEVWWVGIDVTDRRVYERELLIAQRRLRRLQDLSASLSGITSVDGVAHELLEHIVDGVKADDGAVFLVESGGLQLIGAKARHAGQSPAEVDTDRDPHLRAALEEGVPVFATEVESPTSSGGSRNTSTRWQVAALPLRGDDRLLGVVRFGLARDRAHSTDEQQLLSAATQMCAQALERVQLLDRLRHDAERNQDLSTLLHRIEEATTLSGRADLIVDFAVPNYADYATVEIASAGHEPVGLRHRDRSLEPTLRWLRSTSVFTTERPRALAGGEPREPLLLNDVGEALFEQLDLDDDQLAALRRLGPVAFLGLPLIARGRVIGSLTLVQSSSDRRFTEDDVEFFGRLADACALALENARLYEHERDAARHLQTSLLPKRLPNDPRIRLASFYEAGHELDRIGGDWFDAFALDGDRLGLAVGDVVGGGLVAATTMAKLRTALQAYAIEGHGVVDTLDRLNRFAGTLDGAFASSVVYAELDLASNTLTYGCAGHPPPVLVAPGAGSTVLWEGRSTVLGVNSSAATAATVTLAPGSNLLLYTDGLIERRGQSFDDAIAVLLDIIERHRGIAARPRELARAMNTDEHGDDACVLSLTLLTRD